MGARTSVRADLGRVLQAAYAVFAVAATGRSAVQLATDTSGATLPYVLSAIAGVIYIGGFIALRRVDLAGSARRLAPALCVVELLGVAVVGSVSTLVPGAFPDDTVWSGFGVGYGYVPAALPVAALWWLKTERRPA